MLSHDFAKLLLSRRNNDLRFVAEVCCPGHDDEDGDVCRTRMEDDYRREIGQPEVDPDQLVTYDSDDDALDVSLGPIYAGKQGEYTLSAEEVQLVRGILKDGDARGAIERSERVNALRQALNAASR